ncbi:MAG: hypothetical protein CME29_06790 [Gemmatimonadetes bacterium]|nr:hypothetical protein [Gemmatimonadota bacterium]|tara:strand:- start:120849 stop:122162 length:1314 start_codon:yes stop_codon:yes gene_type:complete
MILLANIVYQFLLNLMRIASVFVAFEPKQSSKFLRGLYGRKDAYRRLREWGENSRNPDIPTFWIHVSSAGELLQARTVAHCLRKRMGDIQIVLTFFSSSAQKPATTFPSDINTYLPWDLSGDMADLLEILRPAAILFTQREVWPNLNWQAKIRGIPTILVAATLPKYSKKLRWPWCVYANLTIAQVNAIAAVSKNDGKRFERSGFDNDLIKVTGDPAVDAVHERCNYSNERGPNLDLGSFEDSLIVAGSTWGADEEILLSALVEIRSVRPETKMIIVPHEVFPRNIQRLTKRCIDRGLDVSQFSSLSRETKNIGDVLVVDQMGILPDLYTFSAISYVGGGFSNKGLHSVLEPVAAGRPVLFGPNYKNSLAACRLLEMGVARVVLNAEMITQVVTEHFSDSTVLLKVSRNALGYIDANRGATDKTVDLVCNVLETFNR